MNALERPIGTYLLGRRMYEVLRYWETAPTGNDELSAGQEYAKIWQAADKIVYSTSLDRVSIGKTRIEREFEPEAIKHLKTNATSDLSVGGPTLAAQALKLGLVDECRLFLSPIVVGGGNPALPDHVRLGLELLDERASPTAWSICTTASGLTRSPKSTARRSRFRSSRPKTTANMITMAITGHCAVN